MIITPVSRKPEGSDLDVVINLLNLITHLQVILSGIHLVKAHIAIRKRNNFWNFSMTKVDEDVWGSNFLTVLHACYLQAQIPVRPLL